MKRFELYVDNNNRLVLSEFKNVDSEYESRVLKGAETYDYIKKLASSKLIDICEYKKRNDVLLEYKNHIININDYDSVFKKRGISPLIKNIKDYEENDQLNKNEYNKVKRKNKYATRRIIASGLALVVIGACANNLLKKEDKIIEIKKNNTYTTETELNNEEIFDLSNEFQIFEEQKQDSTYNEIEALNISLNYEDRSSTKKAYITKTYYGHLIDKYANMYGIDSNLVLAIATQERGIHSTQQDIGGATGLMQVQNSVWNNSDLCAFNFNTRSWEKITVDANNLSNLNYNIKVGCMIFQENLRNMNYNPLAAIQCYNMGYGSMNKILNNYCSNNNKTKEDVLNDFCDIGWLEYRNIINIGDRNYIENVLSYYGDEITIENINTEGIKLSLRINNKNIEKYIK